MLNDKQQPCVSCHCIQWFSGMASGVMLLGTTMKVAMMLKFALEESCLYKVAYKKFTVSEVLAILK